MKALNIIESAYRATIEEQDDTIVWVDLCGPSKMQLHELAGDGLAILLVEHDVELVMKVCRRIHVLDFGRIIAVGTPAEVQQDEAVQVAYLGTVGTA